MLTTSEPTWFIDTLRLLADKGVEVPPTQWQSQDVSDKPEMTPIEVIGHTLRWKVPWTIGEAQGGFEPNLPWAEDHFKERVGGEPLNPSPSEAWWPFARKKNKEHKEDGQRFSHTYPERIWPRRANAIGNGHGDNFGIYYRFGDLSDMVNMLIENPLTRQAYLPIWFPEDTGAAQGQRVPCTLGYHFMFRPDADGALSGLITYYMRSCDALRHLKDDAYMAARLLQWVVGKLRENEIDARPNTLLMHISSLHLFKGDLLMVNKFLAEQEEDQYGYGV